jgi:hypothetical protein
MGSSFSEKHYGFFRGIVIQNNDPERRGRVKIFIPEFAVHLARELGLPQEKLEARFVGGKNIKTFLTPEINRKLKNILKWAEQSHPLIGSGTSGNYDAKNNIATVGEGHRGRDFEQMSPDTITPSGESVAPKAPYTTHGIKGLFDVGYKTGGADVYNDVMAPTSYNNAAKGSFSIPKVGSQVWVFFENGSLDYPVYFGYVFDKNDWKTVFNPQDSNPDVNYPAASENIEETDTYYSTGKTVFNSKAGSLEFIDTDDFEKIKLSHYSGSFLEMGNHVTMDINVENKNTVVNENSYVSIKGDSFTCINGETHNTYRGYVYTTYGDLDNKALYEDWESSASAANNQSALFSDNSKAAPDPTQTGASKGGPNDTYKLPDKLTLRPEDILNGGVQSKPWSELISNMDPLKYIKKDQLTELGVQKI